MSTIYHRWGKRILDVAGSAGAVLILSPVMAAIALLLRLSQGAPVYFIQQRPGLHGKPFTLMKFRTMTNGHDSRGKLLPDAKRIHRMGRVLRRTSLDELPELWNVVRGEMSLVGPRPLLMNYLDRYTRHQARRHEVKPGITGWAQVNGRNALNWDAKFELDVWYVDHRSLWLDLKILALTVWQVVAHQGISHPGSATMPEFQGHRINRDGGHTTA